MLEYSERRRYRTSMRSSGLSRFINFSTVGFSTVGFSPLALILLGGLTTGCAYSMGTGERRLPEGYQLVAIPVFKNSTQEVGIEVPFTNAIIRELARSQIARVVNKTDAQVVLEGDILNVAYTVATQSNCDPKSPAEICKLAIPQRTVLNTEYRITVSTKLKLRRVSDSKLLWEQDFNAEKSYLAPRVGLEGLNSANALYNRSARQENISSIASDMMAEAHGRLTENF